MCVYIYIYIYIYICCDAYRRVGRADLRRLRWGKPDCVDEQTRLVYGFCYHFNDLLFSKTQHINDNSAAHVVVSFVSSEILKCRSLKLLLDLPMNEWCVWSGPDLEGVPKFAARSKSGWLRDDHSVRPRPRAFVCNNKSTTIAAT